MRGHAAAGHLLRSWSLLDPRGLALWLLRSYAVPLVSLEFAIRGGAAQDPAEKAGLGSLMSGLLDEGAGDLDSQAFHRALDEKAIELLPATATTGRRMRTLAKNLDRAAELLRLAVNAPRFDEEPFERVREHMNARLRHDANDPGDGRRRNWRAKAFPGHPTACRPTARSKPWRDRAAPTLSRRPSARSPATS